jgi:serine protein kinase
LNADIEPEAIAEFLERHPHYDKDYTIRISGRISPFSEYVLQEFMRAKDLTHGGLMAHLKVKRMVFDARTKTGIGSYTPRDEKSQEAGSLVGNIDYSLLPRFGSESHPLVHDYKGELCAGANGLVEIHEILKLSDKFLYELLFATQDRFFKPEGQPPIPFNGVIIGHTNFHEYNMFMGNASFEALRSRTTFIEMPLSVNFKEEEKIYAFTYANELRHWAPERQHLCHVAPHSLEMLSLIAVMSRLYESKRNPNLSLLQKALIYAGRSDSGVDNNMAKTILDEFEFTKPSEGTFGVDPRFIQNVFENTEHFQINEHQANVQKLAEEAGDQAMLTSIALRNPCVTPLDLYVRLEHYVKETLAQQKTKLNHYVEKILPLSKSWIFGQVASDVYGAILRDDSVIESTWKKYTDHVRAYAHNTTVKHEVTQADVKPDERFMQTIEQYLGIPEKDVFRKELSDAPVPARLDRRPARPARLPDPQLPHPRPRHRHRQPVHRAPRSEALPRSGAVRSGPVDARVQGVAAAVCLLPVRWRLAPLHRGVVRVDGAVAGRRHDRPALEARRRAGVPRGAAADRDPAHEARAAGGPQPARLTRASPYEVSPPPGRASLPGHPACRP